MRDTKDKDSNPKYSKSKIYIFFGLKKWLKARRWFPKSGGK